MSEPGRESLSELRGTAHLVDVVEVVKRVDVDIGRGLDSQEAQRRLVRYGPNELHKHRRRSAWAVLLGQFKSMVVGLLLAATAVSLLAGDVTEALAIVVVIAVNGAIGFATEMRAVRSMDALRRIGATETRVRRDGVVMTVPAQDVVPGDVVVLEGGDIVTADARLIRASKLQCDESALTGESVPVSKSPEPLSGEVVLAERRNMLFKGTSVTRGSGEAVVVGTGMSSELGAISSLVEQAHDETTPLEQRLNELGGRLAGVIVAITVIVAVTGIVRGKDPWLMVQTGIALAVASIPEGLPIVATIALSRGMLRMARQNALVRRLASVETLGSTSVICTDKTGTLTENRMTVERIEIGSSAYVRDPSGRWTIEGRKAGLDEHPRLRHALEIGILCNNAALAEHDCSSSGDPLELALLAAAEEHGLDVAAIRDASPEVREDAFESETKMMATFNRRDGKYLVAVKGAPEAVLKHTVHVCDREIERVITTDDRAALTLRAEALGREGYRLIAVASREASSADEEPYSGLSWVALLGIADPPRRDVRATIDECRRAGIRVVMVTGDQAQTAHHVARTTGIVDAAEAPVVAGIELQRPEGMDPVRKDELRSCRVFSRVDPRQKLELVALHQEVGEVVAMTGDGVNDAPALKKADIGVAMGVRGTQVARDVADVVLKDDAFATIVYAVREGRVSFGNIRKFVLYLLSCNIAEILVIFVATLANMPLPILPLQILFLNLVTDVFPALALGAGEGNGSVMDDPPRPKSEPILTQRHWVEVSMYGFMIAAATLLAHIVAQYSLDATREEQVTISFLTLASAQLWHVFNMRDAGSALVANQITSNKYVWLALALCAVLLAAGLYVDALAGVLRIVPLSGGEWALVAGCSLLPVVADGILRVFYKPAPR